MCTSGPTLWYYYLADDTIVHCWWRFTSISFTFYFRKRCVLYVWLYDPTPWYHYLSDDATCLLTYLGILDGRLPVTQVGSLRECWCPGVVHTDDLPPVSVVSQAIFIVDGILFQSSTTLCEKKFRLTSSIMYISFMFYFRNRCVCLAVWPYLVVPLPGWWC